MSAMDLRQIVNSPPPLLQKKKQAIGLNRSIEEVLNGTRPLEGQSNSKKQIPPSLPDTPTKLTSKERKGSGIQGADLNADPITPKRESFAKEEDDSPSPSPSKRKRSNEKGQGSPSKAYDSPRLKRWSEWEEDIILKAVVTQGEKTVDWQAVQEEINTKRGNDEARTINGIRLKWFRLMRPKLIH